MRWFDCHADTFSRMQERTLSFSSSELHINRFLCRLSSEIMQVFALYTPACYQDRDGWTRACDIWNRYSDFSCLPRNMHGIWSIEDARILEADPERVWIVKKYGVKIVTLFWKGENHLGGAWDTECGLTADGRMILRECFRANIVPDISHASLPSAEEILFEAKKADMPVIASHGGARAVYSHMRNLPDDLLRLVIRSGGLCGITLYAPHLSSAACVTIDDFLSHVLHILSLGGKDALCLGSDFDGCDTFPAGIHSAADIPLLYQSFWDHKVPPQFIRSFFWNNGASFARRFLIC